MEQIKKLASKPDCKKNIRINIIMKLCNLKPKNVCTAFSFSNLCWSHISYSPGEYVSLISNRNDTYTKDALIADDAIQEGCILVTNDKRLSNKVKELNKQSITYESFLDTYLDYK